MTPDFEMGVVEGMVSGLLRSKGEGREPRTPSFQTRLTPLVLIKDNIDLRPLVERNFHELIKTQSFALDDLVKIT
jgi:hypothetical protein